MRYTIQKGDTLWDLARKHNITVDDIMRANPHITDRNKIFAGRAINLPDAPLAYKAAASGSSPSAVSSPGGQAANLAQDGTIRPPLFPNATPQYPNQVSQDAAAAKTGMESTPETLMALGVGLGSKAVVEAIPAMAKLMPKALPAAGQVAPTASNVALAGGNAGASRAMAQGMLGEQAGALPVGASMPEAIQWYLRQIGQGATKNWGF